MIAVNVHRAVCDSGIYGEIIVVIEPRAGPGIMRDELQPLRKALFGFKLQGAIIAVRIHPKVVAHVRRATRQLVTHWQIGQTADSLRYGTIRINKSVEKWASAVRR